MPAESVGDEIRHLMRSGPDRGPEKGKRYGQKRAVAAALNMARRGKIRAGKRPRGRGKRRGR